MSDFLSFENLAHLAGFAGFLLSLVLAILELYWRITRLTISSARAYACEADDGRILLFLRFVASNCSSLSFALTDFSFRRNGTQEIHAAPDRIIIMKAANDPSSVLSNDPCPIPIPAYGAVCCNVLFCYGSDTIKLLPPKLKKKEYPFDSLKITARSRKEVDDWKIHLFIYTSRGRRLMARNLQVRMLSTSEVQAVLDHRLDRNFV